MPLYLSGSQSSRVTKPRKVPSTQRSHSLPLDSAKRTKSVQRGQAAFQELPDDDENGELDMSGSGKIIHVLEKAPVKGVLSACDHIRSSMFEDLPERAGMNSVRIAEVLNFQKHMPPLVTLAHIHALCMASSKTEREVERLLAQNRLRRVHLTGRGNEVSGLSELVVSAQSYEALLRKSGLDEHVVSTFLSILQDNPRVFALPSRLFSREHIALLFRHGFLVAPSITGTGSSTRAGDQTAVSSRTIARSESGSHAAVGGEAAFETLGGVNGARRTAIGATAEYLLSVPGISAFVQLLEASRTHLMSLLRQFSKHRQAPVYLLRERWNGNVDSDENNVSVAKRIRGEFSKVPVAKTRKWKALYGLSFDWVLEECLGAGLIELFETHSVGMGVRALA